MSPLRYEDLPKALRDRVRAQLKGDAPSPVAEPDKPVAAAKAPGGTKPAAATGPTSWQCCRCSQEHNSLAAMERHAYAARHPRYRQVFRDRP